MLHGHVRVVREDERTWNNRTEKYDTKEGKSVEGELDAKGSLAAHIDLSEDEKTELENNTPNSFTDLHYAAYVTDASTHRTEQRRFDVRVTAHALHIYLTGQPAQTEGLPQQYFLAVSSADGSPDECDLDLSLLPHTFIDEPEAQRISRALPLQHLHTSALGLVRVDLPTYEALQKQMPPLAPGAKPGFQGSDNPTLYIAAHDANGRTGSSVESLEEPQMPLRLTPAKRLYRPGDTVDLTVESATLEDPGLSHQRSDHPHLTQHGDLVLGARQVKLAKGRASVSFVSDERYTGELVAVAFAIPERREGKSYNMGHYGRYGQDDAVVVASTDLLFPRDNALHVSVKLPHDTYRPGDEAIVKLAVRGPQDVDGDLAGPNATALGIVAVDQAVVERNRSDSDFGGSSISPFYFRMYPGGFQSGDVAGITIPFLRQLDLDKPLPSGLSSCRYRAARPRMLLLGPGSRELA